MLHELVHNVQGPHNAVFYKLLDEITAVLAQTHCATVLTATKSDFSCAVHSTIAVHLLAVNCLISGIQQLIQSYYRLLLVPYALC